MRQNNKKLIIKGYYFLSYPGLHDWPEDIHDAFSDVRVDVGYADESGVSNYSFFVYTIKK